MSALDLLRALRSLFAQRTRAALTLLGIVIGTASIVLLAALLGGGRDALMRANQDITDSDQVVARADSPPPSQKRRTRRELSRADAAELMASRALEGTWIGSERSRTSWARTEGRRKRVTVVSAAPEAPSLYRLAVSRGRFLDRADLDERRHVCVVGHEVWRELLQGSTDLAPLQVTIDGEAWSVVGVLADKPILGSTDGTHIWNRKVMVPETSYDTAYNQGHGADKVIVRPAHAAGARVVTPIDTLRAITRATLLRRHYGVKNFDLEEGSGRQQEELILATIQLMLFGTAAISLLVGGINVMNVMLVTVTERTREIGIRRAVGAAPKDIVRQFLLEAASVTGAGGLLGVVVGVGAAWAATAILRAVLGAWALYIEPWAIGLSLASAVVTGVVFGLYPALRAARLDPIDALRAD